MNAEVSHKKRQLLAATLVLCGILMCMVMLLQRQPQWDYDAPEQPSRGEPVHQRHLLEEKPSTHPKSPADEAAEEVWFKRLREPLSRQPECRGHLHLVMQYPILAGVNFRQEQMDMVVKHRAGEGNDDMDDDARRRVWGYLSYVNSLSGVHRERRQAEYTETLRRNVAHPHVKEIHLLLEHEGDKNFIVGQGIHDPCGKLKFVTLGKHMTYQDAISYANTQLTGEICMIMNSDVFLGDGYGALTIKNFNVSRSDDGYSSENPTGKTNPFKVYALSRYEVASPFCVDKKREHCLHRADFSSLDAFLFMSPLPFDFSDTQHGDELEIKQNTWGAENTIVAALKGRGAIIKNPCHLLQIAHMHCDSKFRPHQGTYHGKAKIEVSDVRGKIGRSYEL